MFGRLLGVGAPTDAEFANLGRLLMAGDPMMDDVVAEMSALGMRETRPLFEQALVDGWRRLVGVKRGTHRRGAA